MHGHVAQAGGADQFTEAALLAAEADPLPDFNTEGTRKEKNEHHLRLSLPARNLADTNLDDGCFPFIYVFQPVHGVSMMTSLLALGTLNAPTLSRPKAPGKRLPSRASASSIDDAPVPGPVEPPAAELSATAKAELKAMFDGTSDNTEAKLTQLTRTALRRLLTLGPEAVQSAVHDAGLMSYFDTDGDGTLSLARAKNPP